VTGSDFVDNFRALFVPFAFDYARFSGREEVPEVFAARGVKTEINKSPLQVTEVRSKTSEVPFLTRARSQTTHLQPFGAGALSMGSQVSPTSNVIGSSAPGQYFCHSAINRSRIVISIEGYFPAGKINWREPRPNKRRDTKRK
jgi:hypothetical protein